MNRLVAVSIFLLCLFAAGMSTAADTPLPVSAATPDTSTTGSAALFSNSFILPPSPATSLSPQSRVVSPSGAMYRSLALAGWGQLENQRRGKAALFMAAEAICIGGYIFWQADLSRSGHDEYEREAIRMNRNTYLLYWIGAKVFGIMDAYVDAQLRGYDTRDITPPDLRSQKQ